MWDHITKMEPWNVGSFFCWWRKMGSWNYPTSPGAHSMVFFSGRFDGRKHQITSPFPWRHFWNVSFLYHHKGKLAVFCVAKNQPQHANPWISCISDVPFLSCICGRFSKILEKERSRCWWTYKQIIKMHPVVKYVQGTSTWQSQGALVAASRWILALNSWNKRY